MLNIVTWSCTVNTLSTDRCFVGGLRDFGKYIFLIQNINELVFTKDIDLQDMLLYSYVHKILLTLSTDFEKGI